MNLAATSAAAALAQPIETLDSSQRRLATLGVLKQNIDQDRKEDMLYQELEAKEYEEISALSSQLLERDRVKVQEEAIRLQRDVRDQISASGGRKNFFSSGGVAAIKKYKSDLLNSESVLRYRDNKVNMEKIMGLQAAGKSHLLAPRDLKALQEYQNGEGDKITYSGLMSDVDYSIQDMYPFGVEVPDVALLNWKDNRLRIYGNYLTENGKDSLMGLSDAQVETNLLAFMNKMQYNIRGKDEFYRQQAAQQRMARQSVKESNVSKEGTSKEKRLWTSEVDNIMKELVYDKNVTPDQIRGNRNYLIDQKSDMVGLMLGHKGDEWQHQAKKTATESGPMYNSWFRNDYYRPASAMKVFNEGQKAATLIDKEVDEEGFINYTLTSNLYNANGQKFSPTDVEGTNVFTRVGGMPVSGKAKVLGAFIGFKADDKIIMNRTNSDGKITIKDEEFGKEAYGNSSVSHSMFVAMQDETGETFYQEVNMKNAMVQAELNNILKGNDITETSGASAAVAQKTALAKKKIADNKESVRKQIDRAGQAGGAFTNNNFVLEANKYTTSAGDKTRTKLIKSWYMAMDAINNNGTFNQNRLSKSNILQDQYFDKGLILDGDDELQQALLNFNEYSDASFVNLYQQKYNNDPDMDDESIQANNNFVEYWKNYYQLIR